MTRGGARNDSREHPVWSRGLFLGLGTGVDDAEEAVLADAEQ